MVTTYMKSQQYTAVNNSWEKRRERRNMVNSRINDFMRKIKWFGLRKLYWAIHRRCIQLKENFYDHDMIFPEYAQSLIKRKISRTLIKNYNGDKGQNVNFTQYFLGFGLIHYALIRNIKPKNILCIGSRKGYIPAILALACKDNGIGHVDFVDAGYDRDKHEKHWSGVGFWKKNDPIMHFAKIGVNGHITTYVMTNEEFAKKHPNEIYDYIYIDGDHSYNGAKLDYTLFWPKLTKYGFMVFHDVYVKYTNDLGYFGVWKLWKELKTNNKIVFPFPEDSGLGILQKK